MKQFSALALPLAWGPWTEIQSHLGSLTFTITYAPLGDTLVMGRVRYFKKGNPDPGQVVEEFKDETSITTSNSVANIEVSFKGIILGSAVNGTIEP